MVAMLCGDGIMDSGIPSRLGLLRLAIVCRSGRSSLYGSAAVHSGRPQLEFIQKNDRVGDLEGEKLTEHQITEGAHNAARTLGMSLGLLTAVPRRMERQKPWFDFLVCISDFRDEPLARHFLQQLDLELATLNFLWRARRKEGVVAAPRLLRLPEGSWDTYIQQELRRRGTGDFQYKHPGLVQDQDWLRNFRPIDTICLE